MLVVSRTYEDMNRGASSEIFATWNIGTLTGKFIKVVGNMIQKMINIMYDESPNGLEKKLS